MALISKTITASKIKCCDCEYHTFDIGVSQRDLLMTVSGIMDLYLIIYLLNITQFYILSRFIVLYFIKVYSRGITFGAPRYYFQNGTAETYQGAEYGVFKVSPSGRAILVGLADSAFDEILKVWIRPQPAKTLQSGELRKRVWLSQLILRLGQSVASVI